MAYRLSGFLKEFIDPVAAARGWDRDRINLGKSSPQGDIVTLNFQRSQTTTGDVVSFYVNTSVVPRPLLDFGLDSTGRTLAEVGIPGEAYGIWLHPPKARVIPTSVQVAAAPELGPNRDDRWCFDARDRRSVLRCGNALVHELSAETMPALERYLDRATLVRTLEAQTSTEFRYVRFLTAMFKLDAGDTTDLDTLLYGDEPEIVWARDRVRRSQN